MHPQALGTKLGQYPLTFSGTGGKSDRQLEKIRGTKSLKAEITTTALTVPVASQSHDARCIKAGKVF
jgi:hypothetical protein